MSVEKHSSFHFTRIVDLSSMVLVSLACTQFLNVFFRRLESPFMDFYFSDKTLSFPQIKKYHITPYTRRICAYSFGAYLIYKTVRDAISQDYLFDLGLEYRDYLAPN